jgi:hypothetical protein
MKEREERKAIRQTENYEKYLKVFNIILGYYKTEISECHLLLCLN